MYAFDFDKKSKKKHTPADTATHLFKFGCKMPILDDDDAYHFHGTP